MEKDLEQNILLSICIPSYNRPEEISRLLRSIDIDINKKTEILICEDMAPKRAQVAEIVKQFMQESAYEVVYHENDKNYGYDANLRQCITHARGEWITFMGDDDAFIPDRLNAFYDFLAQQDEVSYVLRSYQSIHVDGSIELFKYYADTKYFPAGYETYLEMFRKSVFISGFTFRKEIALETLTDRFDSTLLYQLYVLAEICMKKPAAYYGIPITQQFDGGTPYFGSSETEKSVYTPGTVTIDNSINFMKSWFVVTEYIDEKYHVESTAYVKKDWSKYAYPVLAIQRKKGRKEFAQYHKRLCEIGLNVTVYYYIYYFALYWFGEHFCDNCIRTIKKVLGKTPRL